MTNLIVLRGPSASGKSTVAKLLKESLKNDVAYLDFDVFRNDFLNKQGEYYSVSAIMFMNTAAIALESGYDVILDGFYREDNFPELFPELIAKHPENNYIFYFDVSLETTIKRHSGREKSTQFGEKELREWYHQPQPKNVYYFEYNIPETLSATDTVDYIKSKIG